MPCSGDLCTGWSLESRDVAQKLNKVCKLLAPDALAIQLSIVADLSHPNFPTRLHVTVTGMKKSLTSPRSPLLQRSVNSSVHRNERRKRTPDARVSRHQLQRALCLERPPRVLRDSTDFISNQFAQACLQQTTRAHTHTHTQQNTHTHTYTRTHTHRDTLTHPEEQGHPALILAALHESCLRSTASNHRQADCATRNQIRGPCILWSPHAPCRLSLRHFLFEH